MKKCQNCGIDEKQCSEQDRTLHISPIHTESNPQHLCNTCLALIYPGSIADAALNGGTVHVDEHTRHKPRKKAAVKKAAPKKKSSTLKRA